MGGMGGMGGMVSGDVFFGLVDFWLDILFFGMFHDRSHVLTAT